MRKRWLLFLPIAFSEFACSDDMLLGTTGGVRGEGVCPYVLKKHTEGISNSVEMDCAYNSSCSGKLYFFSVRFPEEQYQNDWSTRVACSASYEYEFVQSDKKYIVKFNSNLALKLDSDEHLRYSLFDIDNVERKYDMDFSKIIHSYTVRGDSIDVKVMEKCSLSLHSCKKETEYGNTLLPNGMTVYGNLLPNGIYTFSASEGCDSDLRYKCSWQNQGPTQKDNLEIHATIYWK